MVKFDQAVLDFFILSMDRFDCYIMPAGRDRYSHNKYKDLELFLEQLWIDRILQFENENKCCKSPNKTKNS